MKKRIVGTLMALLLAVTVLPPGAISVTSADVTTGLVTTAYADEHKHCLCATADGTHKGECNAANVTWKPYSNGITSGTKDKPNYYYLTSNVGTDIGWDLTAQYKYIVICLNGYNITSKSGQTINITSGGEIFTITDCKPAGQQGEITHTEGNGVGIYVNHSTFNMYGGRISGNTNTSGNGGGVLVEGTFNMYGGTISDNTTSNGGGVYVKSGKTFNMYGGTISNNTADYGGGVYVEEGATFTMSGDANITTNTAGTTTRGFGGGVYSKGTFNLNGGTITENTAISDGFTRELGGGVNSAGGKLNLSGNPVVKDNKKDTSSDNVKVDGGTMEVTAALTEGAEIVLNSLEETTITPTDKSGVWYMWNETTKTLTAPTGSSGGETGGETTEHKHCVCGGTLNAAGHTHDANVTWTAINNGEELKKLNSEAGYYYLNASFETGVELVPCKGTYLCLNGKTLTLTGTGYYGIKISLGSEFTLTDCKSAAQQGTIIADRAQKFAVEVYTGGLTSTSVFNMYGGTISGNGSAKTPGVEVERSIFNMYGGTITEFTRGVSMLDGTFNMYGESTITNNNTHRNSYDWYTSDGSAVFVNGDFNMYGGSITGNHNSREGCVYVANGSKFSMYGGTISGNSAEYGGGVRVCGTLEMGPGALIENNGVKDDTVVAKKGGGVYNTGKLIMKGGTITGNKASESGSGVFSSGKFSIGDESSPNGITVKVMDNKKDNAESNVWLEGAETKITVKGSLNSDSEIGITRIDAHEWQYIDGDTSGAVGYFKVDGEANASFNGRGEISSHGEHKHEFNDVWTTDGTYHWHECIVAGCPMGDGSVQERAVHVYDNDTDTTCNTCGYVRTISGGEEKPETPQRYYYNSSTAEGTKDETKNGPKTADAGALAYLGLALSSYVGTALVTRKKKEF